jgi:cytoskeleton protein RodZ
MSEPQHPHPHDTGTNADHPAQANARAVVQPAGPASLDSLAAVGARLAQLREAKNWSIDDVSARLKVSSVKLQALEAGDISHLPDTTFALGVIRSYAKMLGADPAPFTQALRAEKGIAAPNLSMPASSGRDLPRGRVSLSLGNSGQKSRSWLWGVAAVIVAVIALAMWHTNGGDSSVWLARLRATANSAAAGVNGSNGTNETNAANGASGAVAQGETAGSESATEAASATDEGQAATDNAASATPMPAPLPTAPVATSAAPLVSAPAAPKAGSQSAAQASAAGSKAASAAAVVAAASQPVTPAAGESVVAVHVTQDSWFSVRQADGKELFSGLVQAGNSKEISGVGPFKVTVGNKAGLDSITLDGQPVDPSKYASAKGNVARMTLP